MRNPVMTNYRVGDTVTRALSQDGMFEGYQGAGPLGAAQERTARAVSAYAQFACLLSLRMGERRGMHKLD